MRTRRHVQAGHLRAGRQEPEHRLRRRRSRRGRQRRACSACTSTRASAAAPAAGCSSQDKVYDKMVERAGRRRREAASSATRSTRQPSRARRSTRPSSTRSWATSTAGKNEGAQCVTGGERFGSQGLLHQADHLRRREGRHEDRHGRDLRPGDAGPASSRTSTRSSSGPTRPTTAWRPPSGRATSRRPTRSPNSFAPARSGSTATTSSTRPRRSAASRSSGIGRELGEKALDNYTETQDRDGCARLMCHVVSVVELIMRLSTSPRARQHDRLRARSAVRSRNRPGWFFTPPATTARRRAAAA